MEENIYTREFTEFADTSDFYRKISLKTFNLTVQGLNGPTPLFFHFFALATIDFPQPILIRKIKMSTSNAENGLPTDHSAMLAMWLTTTKKTQVFINPISNEKLIYYSLFYATAPGPFPAETYGKSWAQNQHGIIDYGSRGFFVDRKVPIYWFGERLPFLGDNEDIFFRDLNLIIYYNTFDVG